FAWSSAVDKADAARRLDIYGPLGTKAYEHGYKRLARRSIADQEEAWGLRLTFDRFTRWHEIRPPRRPRKVFSNDRLTVTCARVQHGAMPALAFRIRTPDVDLVISGDRGPRGDSFVQFARGAELLIHEILDLQTLLQFVHVKNAPQGLVDHV